METDLPMDDVDAVQTNCGNISPSWELKTSISTELASIVSSVKSLEDASNMLSINCIEMTRLTQRVQALTTGEWTGGPGQDFQTEFHPDLEAGKNEVRNEGLEMVRCILESHVNIHRCAIGIIQKWMDLKRLLEQALIGAKQNIRSNEADQIDFEKLQNDSEYLMEVAWTLRKNLKVTSNIREQQKSILGHHTLQKHVVGHSEFLQQIEDLTIHIKKLVQDTFIIVAQPRQVVRREMITNLCEGDAVEISLLTGRMLGLENDNANVSISIVNEEMCQQIHMNGLHADNVDNRYLNCKLIPNSVRLVPMSPAKYFTASFKQLSLKNCPPRNLLLTRPTSPVNEKFAILFRLEFQAADIKFQAWTISAPFVATSCHAQDCKAWAVVTWDNAFSEINRIPFQLPAWVHCNDVKKMLNDYFTERLGTNLSMTNLECLDTRLSSLPGYPDKMTFESVCKTKLPEATFTFWKWFYEGTRLIQTHLNDAWKDGYVQGFMGRKAAENVLASCTAGTFLLRLCESVTGTIIITFLHHVGTVINVMSLGMNKCDTSNEFKRQLQMEHLIYVYPNTEKSVAFKNYFRLDASTLRNQCCDSISKFTPVIKSDGVGNMDIRYPYDYVGALEETAGDNGEVTLADGFDSSMEIPKENIELGEITLCRGNFGVVYSGTLNTREKVTIKVPMNNCSKDIFNRFLSEVVMLQYLGSHPNVASLIGAYTQEIDNGLIYVVTRFCGNGPLDKFLQERKPNTCGEGDRNIPLQSTTAKCGDVNKDGIDIKTLYQFAYEIASGMKYIASRNLVHRELALRNIFLDDANCCKITDFEMARRLDNRGKYFETGQVDLPWQWMAPESLQTLVFSTKSDVWSFGVTLWEMFSFGEVPYSEMRSFPECMDSVQKKGSALSKPQYAPEDMWKKMTECWKLPPQDRPSFSDITNYFKKFTSG